VAKQSLSRKSIVEAAQQLLEAEGLAGLSMRALGRTLGVEAMALYHHLPSKDALLDAVAEAFAEAVVLPSHEVGWEEMLRAGARSFRQVASARPQAAELFLVRGAAGGPETILVDELEEAGFGADDAGHVFRLVSAYSWGSLVEDRRAGDRAQRDAQFERGLDAVIAGIRATTSVPD
jgi:AcrR family transcriptional regulator